MTSLPKYQKVINLARDPSWNRSLSTKISFVRTTILCQNDGFLRHQEEKREISEHVLKPGEINKMLGKREKEDESESLLVKLGELAGLKLVASLRNGACYFMSKWIKCFGTKTQKI